MNRRIRIGLVGLSVLALAGTSAGGALAASSGRGTANSSITLLEVKLGDLQSLKVLVDEGQGTLDPSRLGLSGPQAFGSLTVADAKGIIDLSIPNPPIRATAPGAQAGTLTSMAVNFPPSQVAGANNLPVGLGQLVTGTINPLRVEAFQDSAGARSAVGTDVPSLNVLSGLVSIKDVKVGTVASNASPASSDADTGVLKIGEVNVLDLSEFLGGLGLGLSDLGVGALTGLVDKLGLPIQTSSIPGAAGLNNIGDISSVLSTVTGLASTLTGVTGAANCSDLTNLAGAGSLLSGLPLQGVLGSGGLLGSLGLGSILNVGDLLSTCSAGNFASVQNDALSTLTSTLSGLTPLADGLLDQVLGVLDGAPLLQLSGVELSALAKAADTLANSSATTTVNLGTLKVGALDLGVLDLNATAAQVTALVNTVQSTLSSVTSVLGLPNLIDIGILERTASTKAEGNYNVADAAVSALRVSINPPAVLSNALSTATALPIGNVLGGLIPNLPIASGLATGDLAKAFSLTTLLSQPTTITVGSIRAQSEHTIDPAVIGAPGAPGGPIAPPLSGELPRTGANGALLGVLAAVALGGAFGLSRVLRRKPVIEG